MLQYKPITETASERVSAVCSDVYLSQHATWCRLLNVAIEVTLECVVHTVLKIYVLQLKGKDVMDYVLTSIPVRANSGTHSENSPCA